MSLEQDRPEREGPWTRETEPVERMEYVHVALSKDFGGEDEVAEDSSEYCDREATSKAPAADACPQDRVKKYDLEERTYRFARNVRLFLKKMKRSLCAIEDAKQLVRSSGSIGANYIEANEALSRKDFIHRIRICRKEAKESIYWMRLLEINLTSDHRQDYEQLLQESRELTSIFGAIMRTSEDRGR